MAIVAACAGLSWALSAWFAPARQGARQLREGTDDEREDAVVRLGRLPVRDASIVLPALTAALGDGNERVVVNAVFSLRKAATAASRGNDPAPQRAAFVALMAMLRDRRPAVREAAVGALSDADKWGPLDAELATTCADALIAALSDPSDEVRAAAARSPFGAHRRTEPSQLLGLLMKALERDPSPAVRREAALSLGEFRSERDPITVALLHALETGEPMVRDACVSALSGLRGRRDPVEERRTAAIVPELIKALRGHERAVRCQAAMVLGELGPSAQDSTSALVGLLKEPVDPEVTSMRRHIAYFEDPGTVAATALGEVAPKTPRAKEIATALTSVFRSDAFESRRAAAAESLSHFSPEVAGEAVPLLLAAANENQGKDGALLRSVCNALGRLAPGTPSADKAVAALSTALDTRDTDTRVAATHALGEFGSQAKSALTRLRALEKDEMPWVQNKEEKLWVQNAAKEAVRRIEAP